MQIPKKHGRHYGFKELSEEDLNQLHQLWGDNSELRKGLATVLGQKGNLESLKLLLDAEQEEDYETKFEIAIGNREIEYNSRTFS
ncbi:MAG: hypothetical protein BalsKO_20630 [Balneolaceae bacterium]